jgi:hypothetical protein
MLELIFKLAFSATSIIIELCMLLATITIALFAYRISNRQLNLQNYQLKHDLYERRYKYYMLFKSVFDPFIFDEFVLDNADYKNLQIASKNELKFLFDLDIVNIFMQIQTVLLNENKSSGSEKIEFSKQREKLSQKLIEKIEDLLTIRNLK